LKKMALFTGLLFSLLLFIQGLYFLAFSIKEGFSEFTLIAIGAVLVPIVLLWITFTLLRRSRTGAWKYVVVGLVIMTIFEVLLPVSPISTTLKSMSQQSAIDNAIITGIHDELLFSANGNPIGVRVTYDVEFPRDGVYSVSSTLYSLDERYHHYQTSMSHFASRRIEPEAEVDGSGGRIFKKGIRYRLIDDVLPGFIYISEYNTKKMSKGDICLFERESQTITLDDLHSLLREDIKARYKMEVHVGANSYFVNRRFISSETSNTYSHKIFYESALKESAKPCNFH